MLIPSVSATTDNVSDTSINEVQSKHVAKVSLNDARYDYYATETCDERNVKFILRPYIDHATHARWNSCSYGPL